MSSSICHVVSACVGCSSVSCMVYQHGLSVMHDNGLCVSLCVKRDSGLVCMNDSCLVFACNT